MHPVERAMVAQQNDFHKAVLVDGAKGKTRGGDKGMVPVETSLATKTGNRKSSNVFRTFSSGPTHGPPPTELPQYPRRFFQNESFAIDLFERLLDEVTQLLLYLR